MNKFIPIAAAFCIAGGAVSAFSALTDNTMSISCADEYTEISVDSLSFRVYDDYAELVRCSETAENEIAIPLEILE